jgi:hypothetical protein
MEWLGWCMAFSSRLNPRVSIETTLGLQFTHTESLSQNEYARAREAQERIVCSLTQRAHNHNMR